MKRVGNDAKRGAKLMKAKAALAQGMKEWCEKFDLTSDEALALCAFITGAAIANQDQRVMTPNMAMDIVIKNLEAGNQAAIAELFSAGGTPQ